MSLFWNKYLKLLDFFKKYFKSYQMDPTKPILDLYGDNYYQNNNQRPAKQPIKPQPPPKYNQDSRKITAQKQISYSQLKQKYQELYSSYNQKIERINEYESQLNHFRTENEQLRQQMYRLEDKNEHLNATLLNKNVQLEQAYRQLQQDLKRGGRNKKNEQAIDRLEEGLKEAINSNFNLLREASLSEIKHYSARS